MKFLKYFEASVETPQEKMMEWADDIVKVLVKYYNTHDDNLCSRIDEIVWNSSAGDDFGQTGELTEEMVRTVISDLEGGWERNIEALLDIYYDCREYVTRIKEDELENIKDVFAEYSDEGKVHYSKTSEWGDNRYRVDIIMKGIFFKINFEEVFGRIKDLGFENYKIEGQNSAGRETLTIEFWQEIDND